MFFGKVAKLCNWVLVANLPHLKIIFITTKCDLNFLLDSIFFLKPVANYKKCKIDANTAFKRLHV
jgi:hypothetical protein